MALHTGTAAPSPAPAEAFEITSGTPQRQREAALSADLTFTVASFLSSLVAPQSHLLFVQREDGAVVQYRWWHPPSGSWTRVELRADRPARIHETGPRSLWAELTPLLTGWNRAGRPDIDHFGLTITPQCHTLWIDSSTSSYQWALPSPPSGS